MWASSKPIISLRIVTRYQDDIGYKWVESESIVYELLVLRVYSAGYGPSHIPDAVHAELRSAAIDGENATEGRYDGPNGAAAS